MRTADLPPELLSEIDAALLVGHPIDALKAMGALDLELKDRIPLLFQRWRELKGSRAGELKVPLDGYWDGFSS